MSIDTTCFLEMMIKREKRGLGDTNVSSFADFFIHLIHASFLLILSLVSYLKTTNAHHNISLFLINFYQIGYSSSREY